MDLVERSLQGEDVSPLLSLPSLSPSDSVTEPSPSSPSAGGPVSTKTEVVSTSNTTPTTMLAIPPFCRTRFPPRTSSLLPPPPHIWARLIGRSFPVSIASPPWMRGSDPATYLSHPAVRAQIERIMGFNGESVTAASGVVQAASSERQNTAASEMVKTTPADEALCSHSAAENLSLLGEIKAKDGHGAENKGRREDKGGESDKNREVKLNVSKHENKDETDKQSESQKLEMCQVPHGNTASVLKHNDGGAKKPEMSQISVEKKMASIGTKYNPTGIMKKPSPVAATASTATTTTTPSPSIFIPPAAPTVQPAWLQILLHTFPAAAGYTLLAYPDSGVVRLLHRQQLVCNSTGSEREMEFLVLQCYDEGEYETVVERDGRSVEEFGHGEPADPWHVGGAFAAGWLTALRTGRGWDARDGARSPARRLWAAVAVGSAVRFWEGGVRGEIGTADATGTGIRPAGAEGPAGLAGSQLLGRVLHVAKDCVAVQKVLDSIERNHWC